MGSIAYVAFVVAIAAYVLVRHNRLRGLITFRIAAEEVRVRTEDIAFYTLDLFDSGERGRHSLVLEGAKVLLEIVGTVNFVSGAAFNLYYFGF